MEVNLKKSTKEVARHKSLEEIGEDRDRVQSLMFDLMNDGSKNYHAAIDVLLALKRATHKTNPDHMTRLGRAVESTLTRVESELFGDFLDD